VIEAAIEGLVVKTAGAVNMVKDCRKMLQGMDVVEKEHKGEERRGRER
jgi:hypothetical protein